MLNNSDNQLSKAQQAFGESSRITESLSSDAEKIRQLCEKGETASETAVSQNFFMQAGEIAAEFADLELISQCNFALLTGKLEDCYLLCKEACEYEDELTLADRCSLLPPLMCLCMAKQLGVADIDEDWCRSWIANLRAS